MLTAVFDLQRVPSVQACPAPICDVFRYFRPISFQKQHELQTFNKSRPNTSIKCAQYCGHYFRFFHRAHCPPRRWSGARGGSRYVEGCWGFSNFKFKIPIPNFNFHILNFRISQVSNNTRSFSQFQLSTFQILKKYKFQVFKSMYMDLPTKSKFQILRYGG